MQRDRHTFLAASLSWIKQGFPCLSRKDSRPVGGQTARGRAGQAAALPVCTIRIAEAMRADTSVMLLGTINVVVESVATLL